MYNCFKNIAEENISQEFRLKDIDETKTYLIKEINWNELISKKHKKVCTTLNCIEHFLILGSQILDDFNFSLCFFGWYSNRN